MNSTFFGSGMAGDPLSSLGPFLDELLRSALSHPLLVQDVLLHFMAGRYQQALKVLSQALERGCQADPRLLPAGNNLLRAQRVRGRGKRLHGGARS